MYYCKVGVSIGAFGDYAFTNKGSKHKELGKTLTKFGYHSSGCEILYNGMTDETEIYFDQLFIYVLNTCLRIK